MTAPIPTEAQEQTALAQWLDAIGVLWCHVPNEGQQGGKRGQARGAALRRLGLKSGVPDVLVFDAPPSNPERRGAAIELKRRRGGRVSDEQREWVECLSARGWAVAVCKGADDAILWLEALGYGKRKA